MASLLVNDAQLKTLVALNTENKFARAIEQADKLLAKFPLDQRVHLAKADALKMTGQFELAAQHYESAARCGGAHTVVAWVNAGNLRVRTKQWPLVVYDYQRVLQLVPENPLLHRQIISILLRSHTAHDALPHAYTLLAQAQSSDDFYAAATVLKSTGHLDEARTALERALQLNPQDTNAKALLLQVLQFSCAWSEVEAQTEALGQEVYASDTLDERSHESVLSHVAWCMNEAWNLKALRSAALEQVGQSVEAAQKDTAPCFNHQAHNWGQRLRIGYVSCDFHAHATMHLLAGVLAAHDRSRVEIFAYDHSPRDGSDLRGQFEQSVEHVVDIRAMSDADVAQRIYDDQIDILVDLKGITLNARLGIFVSRPAPVQVTYLGFPGSAGLPYFDYILSDALVTPDSSRPHYLEKLCRLPETYQCNNHQRLVASNGITRAEERLPEDAIVFCSFNQSYKIDRLTFETWMEVLRGVPNSVLWLLYLGDEPERNLKKAAQELGVDPSRLIFSEKVPGPIHLDRLQLADIALDTRVYNGHTTTSDALWMGVPVITVPGTHFASRVSASLLTACQLPQLIAKDMAHMAQLGIELGNDRHKLQALKQELRTKRFIAPLYDSERFTRHLELAFFMMADRARQNLPPDHIDVPALPARTEPFTQSHRTQCFPTYTRTSSAQTIQRAKALAQWPQTQCPLCACAYANKVQAVPWRTPIGHITRGHWVQCNDCMHIFTEHYWSEQGRQQLPETPLAMPSESFAAGLARQRASDVVRQAVQALGGQAAILQRAELPKWLDVQPQRPELFAVAQEWGFATSVLTNHPADVALVQSIGGVAACADFTKANINGVPDVISLYGTLERAPYPDLVLTKAVQSLPQGGVLVVGFSNAASGQWKLDEAAKRAELWQDPQRLHWFSLASMQKLLKERGLRIVQMLADASVEYGLVIVAKKEGE